MLRRILKLLSNILFDSLTDKEVIKTFKKRYKQMVAIFGQADYNYII